MNRIIKFLLLTLYVVISFSTANLVKNNLADSQIEKFYENKNYTHLYLPSSVEQDEKLISITKEMSELSDTSFIFKSVFNGNEGDGKGDVDFLKLKNLVVFYSTDFKTKDLKKFESHGFQYVFYNAPISKISATQLTNSELYIYNNNQKQIALKTFSQKINKIYDLDTTPDSLTAVPKDLYVSGTDIFIGFNNSNLTLFIFISLMFFAILLFIWLSTNNKTVAIYRLNGASSFRIGIKLFLKEFLIVTGLTYLLASVLAFKNFNMEFSLYMLVTALIVIFVSYISISIVSNFSLASQLNSKTFFRYGNYTLYAIKALVLLVTISTSSSLIYLFNNGTSKQTDNGSQYAVLYPDYTGYSLNNNNLGLLNTALTSDLMAVLDKNKGLYIQPFTSTIDSVGEVNVLGANQRALEVNKIKSANNKKLSFDNDSASGIVLVTEKLKPQINEIKKYYASSGSFKSNTVNYIFIKDNQEVNTLDGTDIMFPPDIIEVYNSKNFNETLDLLHSAVSKFKVLNSKSETYQSIRPILEKYGLLETHPSFIFVDDINKASFLLTVGNPMSYAVTNGLIILVFFSMVLATTIFYFESYKKEIAVKSLYGYSNFKIYKRLFSIVSAEALLFTIYSLLQPNTVILLEALLFYFIIEVVVILIITHQLKKGLILDVLKGE